MWNNIKKINIWVLCTTITFVIFISIVLPKVISYTSEAIGTSDTPDTAFYYTSEELYDMAELYGEGGRKIHIALTWTFDVIWPLVYTGFLMSWIYILTNKTKSKKLYLIPLIAMSFDFLENIGVTIVLFNYPEKTNILAFITPCFSLFKWIALSLTFLLWFILIIRQTFKYIKKQKKI